MESIDWNEICYGSKDVLVDAMNTMDGMDDMDMSSIYDKDSLYVGGDPSEMIDLFRQHLMSIYEATNEPICLSKAFKAFSSQYLAGRYCNLV